MNNFKLSNECQDLDGVYLLVFGFLMFGFGLIVKLAGERWVF
jgi:hypothetical protein